MVSETGVDKDVSLHGAKTLRVLALVLAICLAISLGFNGYTYKFTSDQATHHNKFFSFVFGPTMQNVTQGNLYLNMTFDIEEGNLTVKAEVNTDSYNANAFLALQFDSDNNGTIDIHYNPKEDYYEYYPWIKNDLQFLLRVDNQTTVSESVYWGWLPGDRIYFSRILPRTYPYRIKSPFHYCLYNRFVYTFLFSFPRNPRFLNGSWITGEYGIQGDLVRALYGIEPPLSSEHPEEGMTVYVPPFNFMG